jgi:putative peptide zinc metalloprotease protein
VLRQRLASVRTSIASRVAVAVLVGSLVALTAGAGTATADAHHDHAAFEPEHNGRAESANTTAVAVNTTDHSLVFKLTFAILRVTGNIVDNQNIAVAYASCTGCETVAISIQTLLVDGPASTVAPINEASARNQSCDQCDTVAIAYQFVIAAGTKLEFVPGARREIAYIQRQLQRLREDARRTGMTGAQIVAAVAALMNQYGQILSTELVSAGQAGDQASEASTSGGTSPVAASSSTTTSTTTSPTSPTTPGDTSGGPVGQTITTPTSGPTGTTPTSTTPTSGPTDPGTTPTTTPGTTPTTTTSATPTTTTATSTTPTTTTGTTTMSTAPGTTTPIGTTTTPSGTTTTTSSSPTSTTP